MSTLIIIQAEEVAILEALVMLLEVRQAMCKVDRLLSMLVGAIVVEWFMEVRRCRAMFIGQVIREVGLWCSREARLVMLDRIREEIMCIIRMVTKGESEVHSGLSYKLFIGILMRVFV